MLYFAYNSSGILFFSFFSICLIPQFLDVAYINPHRHTPKGFYFVRSPVRRSNEHTFRFIILVGKGIRDEIVNKLFQLETEIRGLQVC